MKGARITNVSRCQEPPQRPNPNVEFTTQQSHLFLQIDLIQELPGVLDYHINAGPQAPAQGREEARSSSGKHKAGSMDGDEDEGDKKRRGAKKAAELGARDGGGGGGRGEVVSLTRLSVCRV